MQAGGTRTAGRRHGRVSAAPPAGFDVRTLPRLLLRRSHHQPGGWKTRSGTLSGPCPRVPRFSSCLAIESAGQLAAWVTMAALDFRSRPVAGVAADVKFGAAVRPGQTLDLRAEIHNYDDGRRRLQRLGPCRRRAGRGDRAQRGPDAAERGVRQPRSDARALRVAVRSGRAGRTVPRRPRARPARSPSWFQVERVRALLQVPHEAAFFSDHFPRRQVFPGNDAAGRADPDVAAGCRWRRRTGRPAHSSWPPRCRR